MAKLSAHGSEIGRIEFLTKTKAYFTDGTVLVNYDGDWTIYAHIKSGIRPADAFEKQLARHKEFLATHPLYAAYRKALIGAGHSKRSLVHAAISLMPTDPDGVWSECNDMLGLSLTVDEVVDLCTLYKLAVAEGGDF